MAKKRKIISLIVFGLLLLFVAGAYISESCFYQGIPFASRVSQWAIGIYAGKDPLHLLPHPSIQNPVLTADDATDIEADFVADPFMVYQNDMWYMFFEILNTETRQGDIALALSPDGLNWDYQKVILDEPFHLSYPCITRWKNKYYMIPESAEDHSVKLYEAIRFPDQWKFVNVLLEGNYADPSVFHYNDYWWLFTSGPNNTLELFYSKELLGPWKAHPKSPIAKNNMNVTRPGGKIILFNGKIIRYAQDCFPNYGNRLRAFEITKLSTTQYEEKWVKENPILRKSGKGWNKDGMHHVDAHQIDALTWLAVVDGYRHGPWDINKDIKTRTRKFIKQCFMILSK